MTMNRIRRTAIAALCMVGCAAYATQTASAAPATMESLKPLVGGMWKVTNAESTSGKRIDLAVQYTEHLNGKCIVERLVVHPTGDAKTVTTMFESVFFMRPGTGNLGVWTIDPAGDVVTGLVTTNDDGAIVVTSDVVPGRVRTRQTLSVDGDRMTWESAAGTGAASESDVALKSSNPDRFFAPVMSGGADRVEVDHVMLATKDQTLFEADTPMSALHPYFGTWETDAQWEGGQTLWARNTYRSTANGGAMRAITEARDGDMSEAYERYITYFLPAKGDGAAPDELRIIGFDFEGAVTEMKSNVMRTKPRPTVRSFFSQGEGPRKTMIRQDVQMIAPDRYRWVVMMRLASDAGTNTGAGDEGWNLLMDAEYRKVAKMAASGTGQAISD